MSELSAPVGYEVVLTEKAARIIRDAFTAEQADPERTLVRIGAMPGGCSGYKFSLDVARDSDVRDSDARFTSQGIRVVVDRSCLTDVLGSVEVDFKDDNLVEQGFAFRQLEPSATCGCGQSFAPVKHSHS
jgi:iron-sulfur cluster assembly protein